LDLLGFLWWNQGFSMGYARKNKKIRPRSTRVEGCAQNASKPNFPFDGAAGFQARRSDSINAKGITRVLFFVNNLH
jgi:hypothetical protein